MGKGIADKLSEEDKEKVEEAVKETLEWLADNQEAEKEEFEAKQKELEQIANPIIQNFIKLELAVLAVHLKTMKIWMTKTAMNCKFFLAWTNCSHEILGYLVYSQLVKQNAAYWYSHFTQQN